MGCFTHGYSAGFSRCFQPSGLINGIPPDIVDKFPQTDDPGHYWSGMDSDTCLEVRVLGEVILYV